MSRLMASSFATRSCPSSSKKASSVAAFLPAVAQTTRPRGRGRPRRSGSGGPCGRRPRRPRCDRGPSKRRVVEHVGHHVDDDLGHRLPGDPQQLGDGGLVDALGQPGDDRVKSLVCRAPGRAQGTSSVRTRRQRGQSIRQISASRKHLVSPEVEVAPATRRTVVVRPGRPPARALVAYAVAGASRPRPLRA